MGKPIAIVLLGGLIITGGVAAWSAAGWIATEESQTVETEPATQELSEEEQYIEAYLQRQLDRLRNADDIEQKDVAWVAAQLDDASTTDDLAVFLMKRSGHVSGEIAERIKKEYPQYWHGVPEAEVGPEQKLLVRADEIAQDADFTVDFSSQTAKRLRESGDDEVAEYLRLTAPVYELIKQANEADTIEWRRIFRETQLDSLFVPGYYAFSRVLPRVHLHLHRGEGEAAIAEFVVMMELLSRCRWDGNLVEVLSLTVILDSAFNVATNPGLLEVASADDLEKLAAYAVATHVDIPDALARDHALITRSDAKTNVDMADELAHVLAKVLASPEDREPVKPEDYFDGLRETLDALLENSEFAASGRQPTTTLEGVRTAMDFFEGRDASMRSNFIDQAKTYWCWVALELQALKKRSGALVDQKEEVETLLSNAGPLVPNWSEDSLEVWIDSEQFFDLKQDKPLFVIELAND